MSHPFKGEEEPLPTRWIATDGKEPGIPVVMMWNDALGGYMAVKLQHRLMGDWRDVPVWIP